MRDISHNVRKFGASHPRMDPKRVPRQRHRISIALWPRLRDERHSKQRREEKEQNAGGDGIDPHHEYPAGKCGERPCNHRIVDAPVEVNAPRKCGDVCLVEIRYDTAEVLSVFRRD